jgi:hypothetical protein
MAKVKRRIIKRGTTEESIYETASALVKGRVSRVVAVKVLKGILDEDRAEQREKAFSEATKVVSALSSAHSSPSRMGFGAD